MKKFATSFGFVALITFSFAASTPALAGLDVGKTLSVADQANYVLSAPVQLGQSAYQVLSPKAGTVSTPGITHIVAANGLIGESKNQVIVSKLSPAELSTFLQTASQKPSSTTSMAGGKIAVLQMTSFQEAVALRNAILAKFPEAGVSVPVKFAATNLR